MSNRGPDCAQLPAGKQPCVSSTRPCARTLQGSLASWGSPASPLPNPSPGESHWNLGDTSWLGLAQSATCRWLPRPLLQQEARSEKSSDSIFAAAQNRRLSPSITPPESDNPAFETRLASFSRIGTRQDISDTAAPGMDLDDCRETYVESTAAAAGVTPGTLVA